jgi:FAD:protein FMN transferase
MHIQSPKPICKPGGFCTCYPKNMARVITLISLALFVFTGCSISERPADRYEFTSIHMGTQFQIVLYAEEEETAREAARASFERVEELNSIMSDYEEDSELNRLSRTSGSGEAMPVSEPLFRILDKSLHISEITGGMFDITVGPFTRLWRGLNRMQDPEMPDQTELNRLAERVGYEYIGLDEYARSVKLHRPDMQLDLGGIAKGYAADEVLNVLGEYGIHSALVNAGGDITIGAAPPGRDAWEVAVPLQREAGASEHFGLKLSGTSVSTSGNLYQYLEIDGTKYSHIIDPRTGLGVTQQVQATVIAPDGASADAWASALNIMDPADGIRLINQQEGLEAYIERIDEGEISTWISEGFSNYVKE